MSLPSPTESLKLNANKLDLIRAITPTSLSKRKWPKQRNTIDETEHAGALYHRLLTLDYNFKVPGLPEGLENFEQFYQKLYRKSCCSSRNVTPSVSTLPESFSRSRDHSYYFKKQSRHRFKKSFSHGRKVGSQKSFHVVKSFSTESKDLNDDVQPEEHPSNESEDILKNLSDSGDQLVLQLGNEQPGSQGNGNEQPGSQDKGSEVQQEKQESPVGGQLENQGEIIAETDQLEKQSAGTDQGGESTEQTENIIGDEAEKVPGEGSEVQSEKQTSKKISIQSDDTTTSHHSLRKSKLKHSAHSIASHSKGSLKSTQSLRSKSKIIAPPISEIEEKAQSSLEHSNASSPVSWNPSVQPSNPNAKPRKSSLKSLKNKDKTRRVSLLLDNTPVAHNTTASLQDLPSKHTSLAAVKEASTSDHKHKVRKLSRAKTFPPPQEKKHSCVPKSTTSLPKSRSPSTTPKASPRTSQASKEPPPDIYSKGLLEHVSPKVQTRAQSMVSHHSKSSSTISAGHTPSAASHFNIIDPISLIELHHKKYSRRGLATAVRLQRTLFEKEVEHLKNFNKHQFPYPAVRVKWREKYGNVKPITASMIRKAMSKFGPVWTVSIESPFTATVVFTKFLDSCKAVAEKKIETDMIIITIYWYHRGLAERPFSLKELDTMWEEITGSSPIYHRKSSTIQHIEVKKELSEKLQNLTPKQSIIKTRGDPEKLFVDRKKFSRTQSMFVDLSKARKSVPSHIISPRRLRRSIQVTLPEDGTTDKDSPRTDDGRKQEDAQESKEDISKGGQADSGKKSPRPKSLSIDLSQVHRRVPSHIVSPGKKRHTIHIPIHRHGPKYKTNNTIIEELAKANKSLTSDEDMELRNNVKQFVDNIIKTAVEIYAAEKIVQNSLAGIKSPGT